MVIPKPLPESGRIQKRKIFVLNVMYFYAWGNASKTTIPTRATDLIQSPLRSSDFESNCCLTVCITIMSYSCYLSSWNAVCANF